MGTCFSNDEKLIQHRLSTLSIPIELPPLNRQVTTVDRRKSKRGLGALGITSDEDNSDSSPERTDKLPLRIYKNSAMLLTKLVEAHIAQDLHRVEIYMKEIQASVLGGSAADQKYLIKGIEDLGYTQVAGQIRALLLKSPVSSFSPMPNMSPMTPITPITSVTQTQTPIPIPIEEEGGSLPLTHKLDVSEEVEDVVDIGEAVNAAMEEIVNKYINLEPPRSKRCKEETAEGDIPGRIDLDVNIITQKEALDQGLQDIGEIDEGEKEREEQGLGKEVGGVNNQLIPDPLPSPISHKLTVVEEESKSIKEHSNSEIEESKSIKEHSNSELEESKSIKEHSNSELEESKSIKENSNSELDSSHSNSELDSSHSSQRSLENQKNVGNIGSPTEPNIHAKIKYLSTKQLVDMSRNIYSQRSFEEPPSLNTQWKIASLPPRQPKWRFSIGPDFKYKDYNK